MTCCAFFSIQQDRLPIIMDTILVSLQTILYLLVFVEKFNKYLEALLSALCLQTVC